MTSPAVPATESAPAPPAAAPRGKLWTIGIPAGALVVGAMLGIFGLGPLLTKGKSAPGEAAPAGDGHGGAAPSEERGRSIHMFENLVLNPAQSGGTRFLLMAVAVEVSDPGVVDEFKVRDAEARDVLLRVVGANTVERLTSLAVRDTLRTQLADSLTALVGRRGAVRRVYFPQFVVQ